MATQRKPAGFLGFGPARTHGDGTVSFRLRRADGKSFAVSCPIPEVAEIINYFVNLARMVTAAEAIGSGQPLSVVPVNVDGLGIGVGPDPDKTLIVARFGNFHLDLAVPNTRLVEFGDEWAATIKTLSAPRNRKN